jgi:hypothetical protein
MPGNSGLNEAAVNSVFDLIISGGATVRLLTSEPSKTDPASELTSTYELSKDGYSPVNVSESGWTITNSGTFSSPDVLANANKLDFGTAEEDWGQIVGTAIDSGDSLFIVDNDDVGTVSSGIKVTIDAGGLTYEHGP